MTDFDKGYLAAAKHGSETGWEAGNESRAFWDGFAKYMRECEAVLGNADTDTFDY